MIFTLLSSLMGIGSTVVDGWQKRATAKAEGAVRIQEAETEGRIARALQVQTDSAAWDKAAMDASTTSWKDEWFTILLSIPAILAFVGEWGRGVVTEGFGALQTMPDWYQIAFLGAIVASFGLKTVIPALKSLLGR
jgi:hypothetical protein